jgi:hypothetical protein
MLETTVLFHAGIQGVLPTMSKWGMSEVMGKRDSFRQILIQIQFSGDGARDLGNFNRMGKASTEQVALMVNEDLGFVFQAPEGGGMNYTITITLVF